MVRCCYCGEPARGRYCFLNASDRVVDNPYCLDHSVEVYQQTQHSLKVIHRSASIAREFMLRQSWFAGVNPPDLPKDKQDLLSRGAVYVH